MPFMAVLLAGEAIGTGPRENVDNLARNDDAATQDALNSMKVLRSTSMLVSHPNSVLVTVA